MCRKLGPVRWGPGPGTGPPRSGCRAARLWGKARETTLGTSGAWPSGVSPPCPLATWGSEDGGGQICACLSVRPAQLSGNFILEGAAFPEEAPQVKGGKGAGRGNTCKAARGARASHPVGQRPPGPLLHAREAAAELSARLRAGRVGAPGVHAAPRALPTPPHSAVWGPSHPAG